MSSLAPVVLLEAPHTHPPSLTVWSVAQRLSLSADVQTQVSSLQQRMEGRGETKIGAVALPPSLHERVSFTRIVSEMSSDLIPGHGLRSEERAGEFDRQAFLVVLGFVLGHAEKNCSGVGGCGGGSEKSS